MTIPSSRWKVQKANPDVERTHLNKILLAIASAVGTTSSGGVEYDLGDSDSTVSGSLSMDLGGAE